MKPVQILTLENEIEARLMEEILTEKNIPHILRSYHDSVYDSLWQTKTCWGHLEAEEKNRTEIMQIYKEIKETDSDHE